MVTRLNKWIGKHSSLFTKKYGKEFFEDIQQALHLRELNNETEKEKMRELDKLLGTPYVLR